MKLHGKNPRAKFGHMRAETSERAGKSSRGTTQSGVRLYNERLVLSLIRKHQSLPKAEIARLTGLSAQTVSVIVRQLEGDGLLLKGDPQRGKVGQPLVPFTLNPDGAFSIGVKVGRRTGEVTLLDLTGAVRQSYVKSYRFPVPSGVVGFVREGLAAVTADLGKRQRDRIAGLGIAAPFELWNWEEELGAPKGALQAWRDFDLKTEIAGLCDWPVLFCNDATAACSAELFFGKGAGYRDFAYFYVGFFVGGGVVLNGAIYQGHGGNAGAVGSIPVPSSGGTEQLIRHASVYVLENMVAAAGLDPATIDRERDNWNDAGDVLDRWIAETSASLAHAILSTTAVLDLEAAIIDGALPQEVRAKLIAAVREHYSRLDSRGVAPVAILEGSIGRDARAMGAASLPLFANFMIDRDVLFKEAPDAQGT